jgi:ketosteroid isomerase-like protein
MAAGQLASCALARFSRTAAGEIPATGKPIEMRACQIIDVADGKTQQIRQYLDITTMMAQLGVTEARA